jgi:hypothetical protein
LQLQAVENRIDGIFFRNSLAAGYGQGRRFINKGYRKSYKAVLTPEERTLADRAFRIEINQYFGSQS